MSKFKVGDKVRILDVDAIVYGGNFWKNGDITYVVSISSLGNTYLYTEEYDPVGLAITKDELHAIERIGDDKKSSKKQRIATLENEVAELKERLEALENWRSA